MRFDLAIRTATSRQAAAAEMGKIAKVFVTGNAVIPNANAKIAQCLKNALVLARANPAYPREGKRAIINGQCENVLAGNKPFHKNNRFNRLF